MGRFFRMSDWDLDRLLAGKAPEGDEELEELAAFLREVKAAHLKFPPESMEARQLAAILEAAQLLSDKGEPVVRPASKAPGPDRQASRLPSWRRKPVFSTIWAKVAVASVAAVLLCSGLAVAGALPDPLQTAAANAAGEVGVSLDNPGDVDEAGDVDAVDDNDANQPDDNATKSDHKARHRDDGDGNDDNQGDEQNAPAPAVSAPQPVVGNQNNAGDEQGDDQDDQGDDNNQGDDQDNEGDDNNEADDQDNEADDQKPADEQDHEGEDQGESSDD
jgi:hypothetical protein